jgi:hypothetical protein
MESVSLYSEAKNEYLKQLSHWIIPPIVEFFRKEYDNTYRREKNNAMASFQLFCSEVPRWNQDVIETNINIILDNCKCDYIEELMTAVFIAHTKMLTAIRVSTKQKKLQITLPKLDHFLHRVFVECARSFWKAPFLFDQTLNSIERQKNILQAESTCNESLNNAVRSLLPVKSILRDYLDDDESDEEHDSKDVKNMKNVKNMTNVKNEIESSDDDSTDDEITDAVAVTEPPIAVAEPPIAAPTTVAELPIAPTTVAELPIAVTATAVAEPPIAPAATVAEPPIASTTTVAELPIAPTTTVAELPIAPTAAPTDTELPIIEKLESSIPQNHPITESQHAVTNIPTKDNYQLEKLNDSPPQLLIDTEPVVHFTPYDTVFDETTSNISEIRYAPKISIEDKPSSNWGMFDDDEEADAPVPRISISNESESLSFADIEDIDKQTNYDSENETMFNSTGDFETLS